MLNPLGIPTVDKAPSQTRQQIQPLVGLPQQQTTPIGADCSTVKTGHNFPPGAVFKPEAGLVTLRHSESRSPLSRKQLRLQMFMPERTALAYPSREKWRLVAQNPHQPLGEAGRKLQAFVSQVRDHRTDRNEKTRQDYIQMHGRSRKQVV